VDAVTLLTIPLVHALATGRFEYEVLPINIWSRQDHMMDCLSETVLDGLKDFAMSKI
jgi:hypothetical protein